MIIVGQKTILTTFKDSDISDLYIAWLNNKNTMMFSNQRFLEHNKTSCKKYLESFFETSNTFLKISDATTGLMIGTFTIYRNLFHGTADIGILIGDSFFTHRGFGSDAWLAVVNHLLFNERIRKVTAGTNSLNASMINLMSKSEMQLEAIRPNQEMINGVLTDLLFYARYS